jgi:hypothetical protein
MKYKFEFTLAELNVILQGLSKLPYEQVTKFIESIVAVVNTTNEAEETKAEKKEGK